MKKLLLAVLLLQSSIVLSAAKPKVAPNPADYPLTAHVACSFVTVAANIAYVHVGATLDGKQLHLVANAGILPFVLGDYKARLVKDTSPDTYEISQTYELLLPDGKVRSFAVNGIGQSLCAAS